MVKCKMFGLVILLSLSGFTGEGNFPNHGATVCTRCCKGRVWMIISNIIKDGYNLQSCYFFMYADLHIQFQAP